jgi:copper chaperone CopZ
MLLSNMKTVTLKIEGMHCASCPIMIEGTIEDTLQGVTSARASYLNQECVVEYDEKQVNTEKIVKAIEGIGYKASI